MQTEFTIFLTSSLGITLQVLMIVAAIIPAFKYLNQQLENRIQREVDEKIQPVILTLCKDLDELKWKVSNNTAKTDTALKYLDVAVMKMRGDVDSATINKMEGSC